MTLIAGDVGTRVSSAGSNRCAAMLDRQHRLGGQHQAMLSLGSANFGRNLFRRIPEDQFDRQPLCGAGGQILFCADVRLNQRRALAAALGVKTERQSDADLVLAAWERWGVDCLDLIRGDFVFAVYDQRSGKLTLARSVLSPKEIFFYRGFDFVAFASTIVGLAVAIGSPPRLNTLRATRLVAGLHSDSGQTLFDGIEAVEQGQVVEGTPSALLVRRFWALERRRAPKRDRRDVGGELRQRFELAVQERFRRAEGGVASLISAGRDSSAVTVTAARLLAPIGEAIEAYTAAPRMGFDSPEGRKYLVDESAVAARAAARSGNINHHVVRPGSYGPFEDVDAVHRISQFPIVDLPNFVWSRDIFRAAQARGSSVMLTGLTGNMGLSAGGVEHLVDMLREDGIGAWGRASRQFASRSSSHWGRLLNIGLGPSMPPSLYAALRFATGRETRRIYPLNLLRAPHRQFARDAIDGAQSFHGMRPPKSYFDYRRDLLYTRDDSSMVAQTLWGLDVRDPTADRDLIEFCFTLSPGNLVDADEPRPTFRAAFGDELHDEIHRPPRRGLQGADWYEQFTRDVVAEEWQKSVGHDQVRDLFDVPAIDRYVERWPTAGWDDRDLNLFYRNDVLGAVSLANFIRQRF